jgi:hypothetical protein
MATYYVDSSASGANDGSSKTDAFTSLVTAISSTAAGDILLISHTHSEDVGDGGATGTKVINFGLRRVISINFSNDSYTAGARIFNTDDGSITSSAGVIEVLYGILYGMEFDTSTGTATLFDTLVLQGCFAYDCLFTSGSYIEPNSNIGGASAQKASFKKCRFSFDDAASEFRPNGFFNYFEDCSLDSSTAAITQIFNPLIDDDVEINGFDFLNADVSANIINENDIFRQGSAKMSGVKLTTSGNVWNTSGVVSIPGWSASVSATGIDDPLDGVFYGDYSGEITDDSTIYRTATTGTTNYSLKYVTNTNPAAGSMFPEDSLRYDVSTFFSRANPTITVHAFGDHATILTDQEFWIEVEYPLSGGMRGYSSTLHSNLIVGTGTNVTATGSAGDWTGESGSNQRFYNPSITISGGESGIHRVRVYLARASETLYVDPRVDIT